MSVIAERILVNGVKSLSPTHLPTDNSSPPATKTLALFRLPLISALSHKVLAQMQTLKVCCAKKIAFYFSSPFVSDIKEIFKRAIFLHPSQEIPSPQTRPEHSSLLDSFLPPLPLPARHAKAPSDISLSLLSSVPSTPSPKINEQLFSALFSSSSTPLPELFAYFQEHLPTQAREAFSNALAKKAVLEKILQERDVKGLITLSQEIADSLLHLNAPLLLHGIISRHPLERGVASEFIRQHILPKELQHLFEASPSAFSSIDEHIKTFFNTRLSSLSEGGEVQQSLRAAISRAFSSIESKLPLPQSWKEAIKKSVKEDLRELAFGKEKDSPAEKLFNQLMESGLEKTIQDAVHKALAEAKHTLEHSTKDLLSSMSSCLPPLGQDLFNLSGTIEDHVWIEIQKQPNGKFRLVVFSTEYHQEKKGSEHVSLPLVYSDIDPSLLQRDFFYQFFSYQALPLWNPGTSYSIENFFQGLIHSLHQDPDPTNEITSTHLNNQPSLFEQFLRYHLSLQAEPFQKFQFDTLFEALLQMWSHVKGKEHILTEKMSLRDSFTLASDMLSKKALELHQKGLIPLSSMRKIASTLTDVSKTIRTQEKKSSHNEATSYFLPPSLMQGVRTYFDTQGLSPEAVATLRKSFIEIFGEEVREPLDSLLKEVMLEVSSKQAPAPFSVTKIFSLQYLKNELASISSMRFSLLNIYRFYVRYIQSTLRELTYLFSCRLWYLSFAALLPFSAGINLLLASLLLVSRIASAAEISKIIPRELFDFLCLPYTTYEQLLHILAIPYRLYQELYTYFSEKLCTFVIKASLRSLLGQEGIHSLRTTLRTLQQKTTREGELSYTRERQGMGYLTETLPLPPKSPPCSPLPLSEALSLPRPPRYVSISSSNVLSTLDEWIENMKKIKDPDVSLLYINMAVRLLPIPGKSDVWSQLSEKRSAMEKLHVLLLDLHNSLVLRGGKSDPESKISLFALYTITDYLARQCPESLLNIAGTPQGADIVLWAQRPSTVIDLGQSYQQLEEICSYFGFDITQRYTLKEIEKRRGEGSFFAQTNSWVYTSLHNCINLTFPFGRQKEVYLAFLRDPEIERRISVVTKAVSQQEKLFCLFQDSSLLDLEDIYKKTDRPLEEIKKALEPLPIHPNVRGGLLPRSFSLLRCTYLLATADLEHQDKLLTLTPERGLELVWIPWTSGWEWFDKVSTPIIEKMHSVSLHHLRECTFASNIPPDGLYTPMTEAENNGSYNNFWLHRTVRSSMYSRYFINLTLGRNSQNFFDPMSFPPKETQDDILRREVSSLSPLTQKEFELLQMISVSKIDQLMRAFGYVQEHDKNFDSSSPHFFIPFFINQIGVLKAQLRENKESFKSIGAFFAKALSHGATQHNEEQSLFLCYLGEKIRSFCSLFAPDVASHFPDFQKILRETVTTESFSSPSSPVLFNLSNMLLRTEPGILSKGGGKNFLFTLSLLTLAKMHLNTPPETFSEQEKKDAVFDVCRFLFRRQNAHFGIDAIASTEKNLHWLFSPLIEQYLNQDKQLRKRIIETILRDSGISVKSLEHCQWEGNFPSFQCENLSFDFSSLETHTGGSCIFSDFVFNHLKVRPVSPGVPLSAHVYCFEKENLFVEKTATGFSMTTRYQGKVFRWIELPPSDEERPITYWKEEPADVNLFQILCMEGKNIISLRPAQIERDGHQERIKILYTEKAVNGVVLREVSSSEESLLTLLSWFVPLEHIHAYVNPACKGKIAHIEVRNVLPTPLTFSVETVMGEDQALSDGAFPGFFISKKQQRPFLRGFSNYLLLQNSAHEEKVLLLSQPIPLLVSTFLLKQKIGFSSSPFIESSLQQLLETKKEERCYTYSIENEELVPSDTESLAFLLLYSFTHGDMISAKKCLNSFEDLGKRYPYSPETISLLDGLILPLLIAGDDASTEIALRLSSIKMENKLLQQEEPPKKPTEASFAFSFSKLEYFLIHMKYIQYLKDVFQGKRPFLSEFQELFLLKFLEQTSQTYIQTLLDPSNNCFLKRIVQSSELFASHLLLPPSIFERQQFLTAKHHEGSSLSLLAETSLYTAICESTAPSSIAAVPSASPPSLLQKIVSCGRRLLLNPYRTCFPAAYVTLPVVLTKILSYDQASIEQVPVDLPSLSPANIIQYFPFYYRLAMNCLTTSWKDDPEKKKLFEVKRELLLKNLSLLQGNYMTFEGKLLLILIKCGEGSRFTSFPSPDKFEASIQVAFKELKDPYIPGGGIPMTGSNLINGFFHTAWNECRKAEIASFLFQKKTVSFIAGNAISLGLGAIKRAAFSALGLTPLLYAYRACSWGISLFRIVKKLSLTNAPPPPSPRAEPTTLACREALKQREEQINKLFDTLLGRYFDEEVLSLEEPAPEATLGKSEDDADTSVTATLEKVKESLSDYYHRPKTAAQKYILKKDADKAALKRELEALQREYRTRVVQEQNAIEKLAVFKKNTSSELVPDTFLRLRKKPIKLMFEDIFAAFSRGELSILVDQGLIPPENRALLEEKCYLLLVLTSRFQFLFSQSFSLTTVAETLCKRRVYGFDGVREPLLRAKLLFESAMNVLLWKRPMEQLEKMLGSKDQKAVLEALMGWGKSFCLIPLTANLEANRSQIVVTVWPETVAATNIRVIGTQLKKAFAQTANAFRCTRNFLPDPWALRQLVQRTLLQGEQINATREDLQALELQCIEHGLASLANGGNPQKREVFSALRGVLASIRTQGKGVIDEVHKLFDPQKNELNHPIGAKKTLLKEYVALMGKILLLMVQLPEISDIVHLKAQNPSTVDEKIFREKVAPTLLKHISHFPELEISDEHREECIDYALGLKEEIPPYVLQSKNKQLLGLVKGLISPLLPMILKKIINVDYAKPKYSQQDECARPSEGNENPDEKSTIRNPYEAFLKTGILTLQKGITDAQAIQLVNLFKEKAQKEEEKKGISRFSSQFAESFKKMAKVELFSLNGTSIPFEILSSLKENNEFLLRYAEWVIAPQIKFFSQNLKSDPFNFASMFASFYSFTGTPNNDGCFPERTSFHLDPGTTGESVDVLVHMCQQAGSIQILQESAPKKVLDEVLSHFFLSDPQAFAFIDRGALLNGIDAETVARGISSYFTQARPEIQGVVYYLLGEQYIWEKGASKGIPLKQASVTKEHRLTYFDEPHTFAADIPQPGNAKGIISIGEHTTLEQLLQALWRLRGLKKAQQRPILVMTEKVRSLIAGDRPVAVQDILHFCATNEGKALAEVNYLSDRQKMCNVIRRAVLDKILFTSNEEEALSLLREFQLIFVTKFEENPFELYGHVDRAVSPEEVFTHLRASLLSLIQKSSSLTPEEKSQIAAELDLIGEGTYPKTVHVYQINGTHKADTLDDLERSSQVAVEQNEQQEEEQEIEQEAEHMMTQKCACKGVVEQSPPFIPWPSKFSPTESPLWLHASPISESISLLAAAKRYFSPGAPQESTPPLFAVRDVLEQSEDPHLRAIGPCFDDSLVASSNFFQLFDSAGRGRRVTPFGVYQKPLFEVVVVKDGLHTKILLVDQMEACLFRERLKEDRESPESRSSIQIGIYDVKNQTLVATGKNPFKDGDLDNTFRSHIAQLCFLDGQVAYSEDQQTLLLKWFRQTNLSNLKQAFSLIHSLRGSARFEDSDLEGVFEKVKES